MIRRIRGNVIVLVLLMATTATRAQSFHHKALLDSVPATGFYRISLDTALTYFLKTDFSDLRIADDKRHFIPYIIERNKNLIEKTDWQALDITTTTITDSGNSLLVLKNIRKDTISNISLILKNAAVSRLATISGSDDQKHWYIIDNQLPIAHSPGTYTDEMVQELPIPKSCYHYFKIEIDNSHNDPYQIVTAGYLKKNQLYPPIPEWINPMPLVKQTNTNKQSILQLQWNQPMHHDRFLFQVTGTRFFERDLQICKAKIDSIPNSGPGEVLGHFNLVSGPARHILSVPRIKASQLYFIIQNGDNPPLNITDLQTRQERISIIAYLEKGNSYQLLLDDSNAVRPVYDLEKFRDSLPQELPSLGYTSPALSNETGNSAKSDEKTKGWLWPVIIAVLLLLGGLSYRLLKDMKKNS